MRLGFTLYNEKPISQISYRRRILRRRRWSSGLLRRRNLHVPEFLETLDLRAMAIVIGEIVEAAAGEDEPEKVHSGGDEGTATESKEQGEDDAEDVLGAVAE